MKNQLKQRIVPPALCICAMAVFALVLSVPAAVSARVSLSQLQEQIEELQTEIRRLKEGTHQSYSGGLISRFEILDCLSNDLGFECKDRTAMLVGTPLGVMANLDAVTHTTIMKDGEPTTLEENVSISATQVTRANGQGYDIDVKMEKGEHELDFSLSPEHPYFIVETLDWRLRSELISPEMFVLYMDVESVAVVRTQSIGIIKEIQALPYALDDPSILLSVCIVNYGDLKTDYVVCVDGFQDKGIVVPAKSVVLEPGEEHIFMFEIKADDLSVLQDTECYIKMTSPTGRVYDDNYIDIPGPQ